VVKPSPTSVGGNIWKGKMRRRQVKSKKVRKDGLKDTRYTPFRKDRVRGDVKEETSEPSQVGRLAQNISKSASFGKKEKKQLGGPNGGKPSGRKNIKKGRNQAAPVKKWAGARNARWRIIGAKTSGKGEYRGASREATTQKREQGSSS